MSGEQIDPKLVKAAQMFGMDESLINENSGQVVILSMHSNRYRKVGYASSNPFPDGDYPLSSWIAESAYSVLKTIDPYSDLPSANPIPEACYIALAGHFLQADRKYPRSIMPSDAELTVKTEDTITAADLSLRKIGEGTLNDAIRLIHSIEDSEMHIKRQAILEVITELHETATVLDILHMGGNISADPESVTDISIIQRDLKPHNLVWGRGLEFFLIDYGIAQVPHAPGADLPRGTASHADTYQIIHGDTHFSSDNYSLALIIAEVLCGEIPSEERMKYSRRQRDANLVRVLDNPYEHDKFISLLQQKAGLSEQAAIDVANVTARQLLGKPTDRLPNARISTGIVIEILTEEFKPLERRDPQKVAFLHDLTTLISGQDSVSCNAARAHANEYLLAGSSEGNQTSYFEWLELLFGLRDADAGNDDYKVAYATRVARLISALEKKPLMKIQGNPFPDINDLPDPTRSEGRQSIKPIWQILLTNSITGIAGKVSVLFDRIKGGSNAK